MSVDLVNSPSHYQGAQWESIEIIEALGLGPQFHIANALKYLFRHKKKGGLQDIEKALWYLRRVSADPALMERMKEIFAEDSYQNGMLNALKNFGITNPCIGDAISILGSISLEYRTEETELKTAIWCLENYLLEKAIVA